MRAKKIPAGVFKGKCLKIVDQGKARRETVIITKRGKPVPQPSRVEEGNDPIFGFMKGKGKITGDIVSPALTLEEWGDLA